MLAGCSTQVRTSATWTTIAASFREFMTRSPAAFPPFTPKQITPEQPFGMYFFASSYWLLDLRPG